MKKTLLTLLVLSGLAFAALEQEDLKVLHNEAVTLDKGKSYRLDFDCKDSGDLESYNFIINTTHDQKVHGTNGYETGRLCRATITFNLAGEEVVLGEKQYGMLFELVDGTACVPEKVSLIFHYVPEPATATLSLLAFCGLAARRRRK